MKISVELLTSEIGDRWGFGLDDWLGLGDRLELGLDDRWG